MKKRFIKKVAVLGSGVMGSRIACHFAGTGHQVLLLDIVPKDLSADAPVAAKNKIVNQYLRNNMTSRKFNEFINLKEKWTYGYFPLFFQALQKIQNSESADILKKNYTLSEKELCDNLKSDKYNYSAKYLMLYELNSLSLTI
jgi:hypothetical protein